MCQAMSLPRARTGGSARDAAVAQPVEHRIRNARVGGSSPFCGTTLFFVPQAPGGRIRVLGSSLKLGRPVGLAVLCTGWRSDRFRTSFFLPPQAPGGRIRVLGSSLKLGRPVGLAVLRTGWCPEKFLAALFASRAAMGQTSVMLRHPRRGGGRGGGRTRACSMIVTAIPS
jgi:hypothetical protein